MSAVLRFASFVGLLCLVILMWLWETAQIHAMKRLDLGGPQMHALFVIAHPDDEAMFFSPLVNSLSHWGHKVSLLCLSTGDAYGLGSTRRQELLDDMQINFRVPASRVSIVDHKDMQDGIDKDWSDEAVSAAILKEVEQKFPDVDLYVSFDSWGINGHKNHVGTHKGLMEAMPSLRDSAIIENPLSGAEEAPSSRRKIQVWLLQSIGPLRTFLGPMDFFISLALQHMATILDTGQTVTVPAPDLSMAMRALLSHKSQITWYRLAFSALSCYSYSNTYDIVQ